MADTTKIVIFEADIDINAAAKSSIELQQSMAKLDTELKGMKGSEKELTEEYIIKSAEMRRLKREYNELNKNIDKVIDSKQSEIKSIDNLNKRNAVLRAELGQLDLANEQGIKRQKEITEEINNNTQFIKENSDALVQNKMNVGNYTESMQNALQNMQNLNPVVEQATGAFEMLGQVIKTNPILLLATALVGLITAWTKTSEGAKELKIVMAGIGQVMTELTSIAGKMGGVIVKALKDPKQGVVDLGQAIKDNLLLHVKAGEVIRKALGQGDWKGLVNGTVQAVLGIENVIGKAEVLKKKGEDAYKLGEKIAKMNQDYTKAMSISDKDINRLQKQSELQSQIADDDTKGWKERAKASEYATALIIQAGEKEIKNSEIKLEMATMNLEAEKDMEKQTELMTVQIEAQKELESARYDLELKLYENNLKRKQAQRDEFEQDLDIAEKGRNNYIAMNQKKIDSDEITSDEKQKILNSIIEKDKEYLDKEESLFMKNYDKKININELLTISDEKLREQAIKDLNLNEIANNRLLTLLDNRLSIQDTIYNNQLKINAQIQVEFDKQIEREKQNYKTLTDNIKAADLAVYQAKLYNSKQFIDTNFAMQQEALDTEYKRKLQLAIDTKASTIEIDKQYASESLQIEQEKLNAKLNAYRTVADNIAAAFGEGTEFGRAAAIASTIINTIQGAFAAYASAYAIPIVGPVLAPISAAAVTAAGLKSIQKISSVKNSLPSTGKYNSGSQGIGGSGSVSIPRPSGVQGSINNGIVSRNTFQQSQSQMTVQPTLVIDDVTNKQSQTTANKKTSVI
jgi:hypothetical protein